MHGLRAPRAALMAMTCLVAGACSPAHRTNDPSQIVVGPDLAGDTELVVVNRSAHRIYSLTFHEAETRSGPMLIVFDGRRHGDRQQPYPLEVGESVTLRLRKSKYFLRLDDEQYTKVLVHYPLDLLWPTRLVVYAADQPPSDLAAVPTGFMDLKVVSTAYAETKRAKAE